MGLQVSLSAVDTHLELVMLARNLAESQQKCKVDRLEQHAELDIERLPKIVKMC